MKLLQLKFAILFIYLLFTLLQLAEGLKTQPKGKQKPKVPFKKPNSKSKNAGNSLSIRVLQVVESGFTRRSETEVAIPANGEIVVGRDTIAETGSKLILQCSAPYPVQWLYSGDGNPEIITNLTVTSVPVSKSSSSKNSQQLYIANAGLGYNGPMNETDTGEYICKRVQQVNHNWENYTPQFVSLYIYVPGNSLFIQTTGDILHPPHDAHWIRIPCSVTHPDVIVTLQKNDNGFLQCPSGHEIRFSPKSGFIVTSQSSLQGKYVCIGSLGSDESQIRNQSQTRMQGRMQLLEYAVTTLEEKVRRKSKTKGKPKAKGSKFSKKKASGRRLTTFSTFDSTSTHTHNEDRDYADADDDNSESFEEYMFGRNEEENLQPSSCHPSNPCGPNSLCKTPPGQSHLPRCSCRPGYIGRPPKCKPECTLSIDCPEEMSCEDQRCFNPCALNHCAQGARCEVINHVPKCSCPPGYRGNPERNGKCGRKRGPSLTYFPHPRPQVDEDDTSSMMIDGNPFIEFGSLASSEEMLIPEEAYQNQQNQQEQNGYPCEPWPCGPNSQCRPVGEDAHCTCSKGYVGTPPNCRPECTHNQHCSNHLACVETKCRDPCVFKDGKCGYRAECRTENHTPSCYCPHGTYGNPFIKCRLQQPGQGQNQGQGQGQNQGQGQGSYPHPHPPQNQPQQNPYPVSPSQSMNGNGVFGQRPQNQPQYPTMMKPNRPNNGNHSSNPPKEDYYPPTTTTTSPCHTSPCGRYAICTSRNATVGCKCPPSLSGFGSDPYIECYPSNNPCEGCGPHSKCVVDSGRPPFCSCLEGKVGSPPNCRDGFCQSNRDCDADQSCQEGRCDSPCRVANCGRNAVCRPMRHIAVCACRNAPDRDPLMGCPSPQPQQEEFREYYHYQN